MSLVALSKTVDRWIDEADLPVKSGLKVIRKLDPHEGMDEEEFEAYHDFIHWALNREHALLFNIPKPRTENDFWFKEIDEFGCNVSAFNTIDFERLYPDKFSKYHYRLKKIFERVRDLAILHSALTTEKGRSDIFEKYQNLVEKEFRNQAVVLLEKYEWETDEFFRSELRRRIAELNRRIEKCQKIWEQNAPWDI